MCSVPVATPLVCFGLCVCHRVQGKPYLQFAELGLTFISLSSNQKKINKTLSGKLTVSYTEICKGFLKHLIRYNIFGKLSYSSPLVNNSHFKKVDCKIKNKKTKLRNLTKNSHNRCTMTFHTGPKLWVFKNIIAS